ncbi:hypothetical protein [Blastococcus sp. CCUG 61487]|uniref:hypothetical protein n=1 Tax=Blastococcus sp. CCUG 61487 TaxID=1840703 RepID=UPI0010C0F96D|nr:hypothetical protein [Blastococcus sp. CCUG 61487]TKJ25264.1 hypothetical protein A6V29_04380 [Blastococcus sp. CCUG 61487]
MLAPLRLVPGADDFRTDLLGPVRDDDTVEIPRIPHLPPVPAPRPRPEPGSDAAHRFVWLTAAVVLALVILAVGLFFLDTWIEAQS